MEHEVIPPGEIHAPHNWVVADEAARLALVVTAADLGKYCWQRAGEGEWFLIGHTPAVWKQHIGPTGADGAPGADGPPGADGDSAYEVAVANGFLGTEVEWLAFLQGANGVDGADGREVEVQKSATHIQWRYAGDAVWVDLVALTDITGPAGADGADGPASDAWVSFTGATGAILAGSNIASVVRNSTGTYTITFATAMPNTSYAVMVTPRSADDTKMWAGQETRASAHSTTAITVSVRFATAIGVSALADPTSCSVTIKAL